MCPFSSWCGAEARPLSRTRTCRGQTAVEERGVAFQASLTFACPGIAPSTSVARSLDHQRRTYGSRTAPPGLPEQPIGVGVETMFLIGWAAWIVQPVLGPTLRLGSRRGVSKRFPDARNRRPELGHRPKEKAPFPGPSGERMKRLELSTFCMASRRSSQLSYIRVGASIAGVRRGRAGLPSSPRPLAAPKAAGS
ncbi:MAG: hypothetical protein QOH16_1293 [Gaiellaceae bacterium]|nr:hypothetical protein [Gaiellaceae bacterium]